MPTWKQYLEIALYVCLMCFFVPIKYNDGELQEQFQKYLRDFNKTYENETMYQLRLQAFQHSLKTIELLNANSSNESSADSAWYGLTRFSDLLPKEFVKKKLSPNLGQRILERSLKQNGETSKESHERLRRSFSNLPKKIDWRQKQCVTRIRNQRNCGACWAFAAIETMESMNAIKNGKLIDLSVQQMIDCAANNNGCSGGDICSLLSWLKTNKVEVTTEQSYPLTLQNNTCKKLNVTEKVEIDDYGCESFVDSEEIILELLAKIGPVAVAINAQTWQNYIGGTIQFHCNGDPDQLNHAVQLVGYDLTAKVPYYIARNTWGKDFGDKGYLKLAIGKNICGLAHEVTALTVL